MKSVQKMKVLKRALALAAVLVMTGTAWAKKGGNGPGVPGDLSADRTSVTVLVTAAACTAVTQSGAISAYIFQPTGRLLNIGIGNAAVTCSGTDQSVSVTVTAVPGLTFKPGPATLLFRFTVTDSTTTPPTVTVVDESGSRIDLH